MIKIGYGPWKNVTTVEEYLGRELKPFERIVSENVVLLELRGAKNWLRELCGDEPVVIERRVVRRKMFHCSCGALSRQIVCKVCRRSVGVEERTSSHNKSSREDAITSGSGGVRSEQTRSLVERN